MKKFLNVIGVLVSSVLTIVLSLLILVYALILNIKFVVSEDGISSTLKRIDIVETMKLADDGVMWEDFKGLAETLNLSEEQFEKIINSNKIKEQVGTYISKVISSAMNDTEANLTKESIENFLNIAVDEYNKVSNTKIGDAERAQIIKAFDEELIANMNEEFSSINLQENVAPEYIEYVKLADNILFGNYALSLLIVIIVIIGLIALLRFSYYKWIPYVRTSTIIAGIFVLLIGIILSIVPMQDMEIVMPLKNIVTTNLYITTGILFVLAVALSFGEKYLKKYVCSKKEAPKEDATVINEPIQDNTTLANESPKEEVKPIEETKKEKKIDKKTIIIICLILLLLLIILFLLFSRKYSYTITFDSDGGSIITNVEVKNGEIVNLPQPPTKEGYTFAGWTNEEGKIINSEVEVTDDLKLKAQWISNNAQTITATFNTDGGNAIGNIVIEKGGNILLPIEPKKEGYTFVGWLDSNNNLVTKNMTVTKNVTLSAKWLKNGTKTSTVKFDTAGGSEVGSIIVEKGKIILLPIDPTKPGYVFAGWVDENGNAITKDSVVDKNITIKATWKEPYTCPAGCTPIGDGSKCTKTTTKDVVTYTGCPSGTETIEKFCSSHQWQASIGYGEDQFYETAGILCNGSPSGFCVDYNGRYTITGNSCPSGYFQYFDSQGLGGLYGCAKKYNKGGTDCPAGYSKSGNICQKTETINCIAN